ncbi:unnamed protein product [Adineta steineri]|uniref:Uncharacterized protein n=2 Tax=Adineta steineri TaxID=433720 RepID=A0A819VI81_9BILA|nr:unnamed protein product [Adineta steineri]
MSEEEVENKLLKGIEHLGCITIVNSLRSVRISANRISTYSLPDNRQLNEQTSATWKSLININLPQHIYFKRS